MLGGTFSRSLYRVARRVRRGTGDTALTTFTVELRFSAATQAGRRWTEAAQYVAGALQSSWLKTGACSWRGEACSPGTVEIVVRRQRGNKVAMAAAAAGATNTDAAATAAAGAFA
mmetsp:Transcript_62167/g.178365  ORF Transcript_62167/g.178365 Transcript_62167/m.178365 type:complete len:115 (-) Transcript_62167:356-700(-)